MKKLCILMLLMLVAVMGSEAAVVSHWTFDETSLTNNFTGDRLDSGSNDLTLTNLSGTYTRGAAGLDGNAMVSRRDPAFPNAGHYTSSLSSGSALLKPAGSFSFSTFVDPYVNNAKVNILCQNGTYGVELFGSATVPKFNFYVVSGSGSASAQSAVLPLEGFDGAGGIGDDVNNDVDWYHLAGSYDAATGALSLYVDGTKSTATLAGGGALRSGTGFNVGDRQAGGTYGSIPGMLGLYDDLQLYDQVLTDEQVNFLGANPGSVIPEPATMGLVGIFGAGLLFVRRKFMV